VSNFNLQKTPSPTLPLQGKGVPPTGQYCGQCGSILPLEGELEGVKKGSFENKII